jgi:hypothetical protein
MDEFPTLLILTDDCVSPSHGTGAALIRHLKQFPEEKLIHAYLNRKGEPSLARSARVRPAKDPAKPWHARFAVGARDRDPAASVDDFMEKMVRPEEKIGVVYSCVFGETGLQLLTEVLDHLPAGTPTVHHANDFLYAKKTQFERMLRALSPRISEFWSIGQGLAGEITRITGREAALMAPFQCDLRPDYKREHRSFGPDCKAVMLGNSHMPGVLHHLRRVWRTMEASTEGLRPIQWYAYPTSVAYVKDAGVTFEPQIEYCGFLNDDELHEKLCDADFAIVPFNIHDTPEYHYAQFSIPSRITEFVNAGLPIFAAAGKETEACRFISGNELGQCASIADEARFATDLMAFAKDTGMRKAMGIHNRKFAEEQCDIRVYRKELLRRFRTYG